MSMTPTILKRTYFAAEALLLVAGIGVLGLTSRAADWQPLSLLVLLGVMVLVSDHFEVSLRHHTLAPSFIAVTLAMALLGPAPAVAFLMPPTIIGSYRRRISAEKWLNNLSSTVIFPLVGGLLARSLLGSHQSLAHASLANAPELAIDVFVIFLVSNLVNFAHLAIHSWILMGRSIASQLVDLFLPLFPAQLTAGLLAALLATAYVLVGIAALIGAILVLMIFQYLAMALAKSEVRADQLASHSMRLASIQLGVLTTLTETLAQRDPRTAAHSASVANYARSLAIELECDEAEQELVHTSALLHDIGMFTLPDRILRAEVLSEEDWSAVRRHPFDGARLVGRLYGYGPVAEIIQAHHERFDGLGYPTGLIASEIPLAARIIAICEAYDSMTSPTSYRSPMSPQDALVELRRVSGRQFDSDLVESFVAMLTRRSPQARTSETDYEAELEFERRTRAIASPRTGDTVQRQ